MSSLVASLVPETLQQAYRLSPTPRDGHARFGGHGAMLWCDIAKFSPLANELVALGAGGVERLSAILNRHFESVLGTTLAFGGDSIEFFGDGVLVTFFCAETALAEVTLTAAACAATIIERCRPELEPGLRLSLHLYITAGSLRMLDFGGVGGERLFAVVGDAMTQLGEVSREQSANQVILSPSAAALIDAGLHGARLPNGGVLVRGAPSVPMPAPPAPAPDLSVEASEALTAFLPMPVRHSLELGESRWTAELRTISAVFLRLPQQDHAAPDYDRRIHELARVVQTVCRRYEGVVRCLASDDKGAGFQLVFGVPPLAHNDDPLRALRAAQDILAECRDQGLACSAGVTAGVAFLGLIGHPRRRHYAVIGDAINIASRLSHASETAILCDEETMRACVQSMTFETLPPIRVKGRREPLPLWSPIALIEAAAQAAIVGRERELAELRQLIEAAGSGRGGACLLVGEPGMGKSVLMAAVAHEAGARGRRVLGGQSSRVEQSTPFQALRTAFASLFGLDSMADAASRRARLLEALGAGFGERLCLINAAIPLGLTESDWAAALLPAERVRATRRLLADVLLTLAAAGPILLLVEDAHWADAESLLLLELLIREPQALAIVIGARPPASALAPLIEAGAQRIDIGALDRGSSAALIAAQMGGSRVADEVLDLIFPRALGNPFFSAELTRYLQDRGDIVCVADGCVVRAEGRELALSALPISVRATITNRIDAMPPAPQLTLKVESVVGLRAPLAVVRAVHPLAVDAATVADHVLSQSRLGLVERALVDAVDGYEFRHDITREVVYDLVLPAPRQALHGDIARWYEQHHAQDLAAYFGRIAAHWAGAGDPQRAADYLGAEAVRVFSNGHAQEATAIGLSAIRLLGIDLPSDPAAIGAAIGEGLGLIYARTAGGVREALAVLPAMRDERVARQVALLLSVAPLAFQSNRVDLYALVAITALRLTLEHGASADAPQACSMYSVVHGAITGDRPGAWAWSRLALAPAVPLAGRAFAEVAFVHGWFHAHWQQPLRESLNLSLDAAERGFGAEALLFACFNLAAHVIYLHAAGAPLSRVIEAAERHLVRNGRRVKNSAFHLIHELQTAKALAGLTRAPLSFSDEHYDEASDLASILDTNLSNQIGYYLVSKVKLHCHYADWATALDWAARARAARQAFAGQTADFELVQYEGLSACGLALAAGQSLSEAGADCIREMRSWAGLCAANFEHKALLLEGAAAAAGSRLDEAQSLLTEAAAAAETQGFRQDRSLALEWLARVAARRGDDSEAAASRQRAAQAFEDWGAQAKARWLLVAGNVQEQ